jgi:hypothetical protein
MNHPRFTRMLRGTCAVVLLGGLSSLTMAADRSYTVTSPDGIKLAVR